MKEGSPAIVLAACAVAAGFCLIGGVLLARSEHHERLDRSREAHTAFIERLRRELLRLEELYQGHLSRFVAEAHFRDEPALRAAAGRIAGIRQVTVLGRHLTRSQSWNLQEGNTGDMEAPMVTFETEVSALDRPFTIRLDPSRFLDGQETAGWIDEPGKQLYYWQRLDSRVAFVLVDLATVQEAIDRWLSAWLPEAFAPVPLGAGADLVRGPVGNVLIEGGEPQGENEDRRPHVLIPVESRFGTWHLASWDPIRREVVYQAPLLWGSGGMAAMLLLIGVVAGGHQRRAMLDARRRVSFVNHVSHELRSPLTNILLNAELAEEHAELDSRQALKCLGLIREESYRLNRLIGNVLTFARTERESKGMVFKPCRADDAIEEVLAQFGEALERKGVRAELASGAGSALVDRDPLVQIVSNLVSNVEKYGAAGGMLRVDTEVRDGLLTVRVMDRGPGIPPTERERVFEAFVRLGDRVDEGVGGTGLGLHIARNLAREIGGDLRILSSREGAVFELSLPCFPNQSRQIDV